MYKSPKMQQILLKVLLLTLTIGYLHTTYAQPYLDNGQGIYTASPGKNGQPSQFNHQRILANLPVISKKDSSFFLLNPIWERRLITENDSSGSFMVRGLITWLSYTRNFGKKWSVQLSAIPRFMGTVSLQYSQGFQMGGAFLVSHKPRPGLKYQLGMYYNKELFGNFFLPLLGIDWKINARSNLFGVLPGYLVYENRISKKLSWGGNFRTFTSTYRIAGHDNNYGDDYLRVQDNQLGIYTDIYLMPKLVLNAEAGHTVMRRIATGLSENPGRNHEHILSDKDNFYFRLTLQYRLRFR